MRSFFTTLLFAAALFLGAAYYASAQIVPAQNQVIPAPYGQGYLISTSTSPTHKLGTALIDLAGSFVTGILGVNRGGTGSSTLSGILIGNGTSAVSTLTIGSGLSLIGTTLSATGGGGGGTDKWATSTDLTSIYPNSATKVGIGTTTPLDLLGINAADGQGITLGNGAAQRVGGAVRAFNTGSSDFGLNLIGVGFNATKGQIKFTRAGGDLSSPVESMRIDANGNVGIGTSSPTSLLNLSASDAGTTLTAASAAMLDITNRSTTDNNFADLTFSTADTAGATVVTSKIAGGNSSHTSSATSGFLAFLTRNAGTISEKMRILANGNVGIGNTNPANTLDVTGTVRTTATTTLATTGGNVGIGNGVTTPEYLLTVGTGAARFGVRSDGVIYWGQSIGQAAPLTRGLFSWDTGFVYIGSDTVNTDLRLVAGGFPTTNTGITISSATRNVGIGTTSPEELLHLSGTGTATTLGQLNTNLRLQTNTGTANAGSEISFRGIGTSAENTGTYVAISAPVEANGPTGARGYLSFSTKGSAAETALIERMRILGSGNIGIGTSTASSRLTIQNATDGTTNPFLILNSQGRIVYEANVNGSGQGIFGISDNGTRNIQLYSGGASYFNAGNVGIGTSTPQFLLSVGTNATGKFQVATTTAGCAQFSSIGELFSTGSSCGIGGGGGITNLNGLTGGTQTFATTSSSGGFGFSSVGTTHTLNLPTANASNPLGLLSSGDWSLFNNKVSSTSLSATAPLTYNSSTGVFALPAATSGQNGYLTSTDWSTFNGKQAAGNYITALTGDVTAAGPGSSAAVLATVNSNVGSFGSATAIPNFTVNGKGLITAAGTSAVVAPAGTLTGTTLAANIVTSSLTSLGTIGTGVWQGTAIADTYIASASTWNAKESALTFTYPLTRSTNTVSLAFGTTTNNTWSGLQTFTNVGTTTFSGGIQSATGYVSGLFEAARMVVKGISSSFTPAIEGEFGIDTTSNQFKFFSGGSVRVLSPTIEASFSYATSTAWTGTTTIALGPAGSAQTFQGVSCFTDTGTLNVSFYDGTNRMNMFNASTTVGSVVLNTNNSFTLNEKRYVDIGTPASTPTKISCTTKRTVDAD